MSWLLLHIATENMHFLVVIRNCQLSFFVKPSERERGGISRKKARVENFKLEVLRREKDKTRNVIDFLLKNYCKIIVI